MPEAPGNEASAVPELPFLPQIQKHWRLRRICHGKRTSHLHLCGDALQPHKAGRENPGDHAQGLPYQRGETERIMNGGDENEEENDRRLPVMPIRGYLPHPE